MFEGLKHLVLNGQNKHEISDIDLLEKYFINNNWNYQLHSKDLAITTGVQGKNICLKVAAILHANLNTIAVEVHYPFVVSMETRNQIAELCTRINSKKVLGLFKFDLEDGLVVYQTSSYYKTNHLADDTIHFVIRESLLPPDMYYPVFMMVIHNNIPPKIAFESFLETAINESGKSE